MRAMILAAGKGKRLRPITDGCPKPLIKVADKALIVYHLEALRAANITEIVINVSHLGDQIMRVLGDGQAYGVSIQYSVEPEPLETAGGIAKALPLLGDEPFVVVNGDIYTDFSFKTLTTLERQAHLILTPNPAHNPQGDFSLVDQRLVKKNENLPTYTYAGIALFRPEFFSTCQSDILPLSAVLYQALLSETITAQVYHGYWTDVGNLERLKALEEMLKAKDNQQVMKKQGAA